MKSFQRSGMTLKQCQNHFHKDERLMALATLFSILMTWLGMNRVRVLAVVGKGLLALECCLRIQCGLMNVDRCEKRICD